ncbi:short-chain dehydrogenase reductase [Aspergillus sp. HF37]|nr:short-chain dehydrogenase reductase [Aspergillus sp. HF37]
MPPKRLIITSPNPRSQSTDDQSKRRPSSLTLDLLLTILSRTILHPWVAWVGVLSLRAQATPYTDRAFILATSYAVLLSIIALARMVNQRVAYGTPRTVDLGEEVVVVTGGASGLGLLIARIYGLRGVRVAVLDVREVAEVQEGWWEECAGVEYYQCDIGDRSAVEATARKIEKELGTPTVLVNCAAARINGQSLLSLPADAFQKTIRTNLLAVFHTCQVFLPRMLSAVNGGSIVTVSSVLGHLSAAGLSDYSASKAGLSALHQTLESELRVSGDDEKVKTLLVETGQMSTPLFDWIKSPSNFFAPILEPVQVAQEVVSAIDNGRGGTIKLPAFAALATWYSVLPAGLQRIARYLSGIDYAVAMPPRAMQPSEHRARKS